MDYVLIPDVFIHEVEHQNVNNYTANYALFYDIWLLTDQTNFEDADFAHIRSPRHHEWDLSPNKIDNDWITFEEVKKYLNGYARIVEYKVYGFNNQTDDWDPYLAQFRQNSFYTLTEGQIEHGKLSGFGRQIHKGLLEVGYFAHGKP